MIVLKRREHFWFRPTIRSIEDLHYEFSTKRRFFCLLCTIIFSIVSFVWNRRESIAKLSSDKSITFLQKETFQRTPCVVISTNNFWYERARNLFDFWYVSNDNAWEQLNENALLSHSSPVWKIISWNNLFQSTFRSTRIKKQTHPLTSIHFYKYDRLFYRYTKQTNKTGKKRL